MHRARTSGVQQCQVGSGSSEHSHMCLTSLADEAVKRSTHFHALLKSGLGKSRYSYSLV